MELFCQEPLAINDNYQTQFIPDFHKPQKPSKRYTIISFFNAPAKVDLKHLTDFLDQYTDTKGQPRYAVKTYKTYKMRTITYKVINIVRDIPRYNYLFGRSVKCFYDGQPPPKKHNCGNQNKPDDNTDLNEPEETDTHILNQPIQIDDTTNHPPSEKENNTNQEPNTRINKETSQQTEKPEKTNKHRNTTQVQTEKNRETKPHQQR